MSTVNISIKDVREACNFGIKYSQAEIDRLYEEQVQAYMTRRFFRAKNHDQAVAWLEKWLNADIFNRIDGIGYYEGMIEYAQSWLHACDVAIDDHLSMSIDSANTIKEWLDLKNE